jgi:hypothetical protein
MRLEVSNRALQSENDVLSVGYQVYVCRGGIKLASIPAGL